MSETGSEEQVLRREIARLESEGYDVFVHPRAPLVPEFLGDYVPDAVATGKGKKIVLEVANSAKLGSEKLRDIAARFRKQGEWEFRILLSPLPHPERRCRFSYVRRLKMLSTRLTACRKSML